MDHSSNTPRYSLSAPVAAQLLLVDEKDCQGCGTILNVALQHDLPLCEVCADAVESMPWWCRYCDAILGGPHEATCKAADIWPIVEPVCAVMDLRHITEAVTAYGQRLATYVAEIKAALSNATDIDGKKAQFSSTIEVDKFPPRIELSFKRFKKGRASGSKGWWDTPEGSPLVWTPLTGWTYEFFGTTHGLPVHSHSDMVPSPVVVADDIVHALNGRLRWPQRDEPPRREFAVTRSYMLPDDSYTTGRIHSDPLRNYREFRWVTQADTTEASREFSRWTADRTATSDIALAHLWHRRYELYVAGTLTADDDRARLAADVAQSAQIELGRFVLNQLMGETTANALSTRLEIPIARLRQAFEAWQRSQHDGTKPDALEASAIATVEQALSETDEQEVSDA